MKVSLIATVFNEEKSILSLLESVKAQTKQSDEIIITDAGSSDRTNQLIEEFKKKNRMTTLLHYQTSKLNRSQGRNLAIKKAKFPIVAVTDAGCELHPDWLKEITKPFKDKKTGIVAGNYSPIADTMWQRAPAFTASDTPMGMSRKVVSNFLPSSRSIAFRKSAWKKIGGYPENLDTAEDLIFVKRLRQAKIKQAFAENAIVFWHFPKSTLKIISKYYHYAYGDGLAGLESPHAKKHFIKTLIVTLILLLYSTDILSPISLITLFLILATYQSVKKTLSDPLFKNAGFVRGIYFWVQFAWYLVLFPTTLLGFWIGLIRHIIKI